jgi:hypothetical protein
MRIIKALFFFWALTLCPPAVAADGIGGSDMEFNRLSDKKIVASLTTQAGVQIYRCVDLHWELKAAEADLLDGERVVGRHHFVLDPKSLGKLMPAWDLKDGGHITGKKLAARPAAGGVDHLVLHAESNIGKGILAHATDLERIDTVGGKSPSSPCAAGSDEIRIPYSARYVFYDAGKPSRDR